MARTVTPSITAGQIGKLQEILGAGLRKSGLPGNLVQQVLETQGDLLVAEFVSVVRRRVETVSTMIVRRAKVDRTLTPQRVLDATGRRQYADPDVVANMPGRGDDIEELNIVFFSCGRFASNEEVKRTCTLLGLEGLADPYAVAQVNTDDPKFAGTHPNATLWKDASGEWCCVAFGSSLDEHYVRVGRNASGWTAGWRFAAVSASS